MRCPEPSPENVASHVVVEIHPGVNIAPIHASVTSFDLGESRLIELLRARVRTRRMPSLAVAVTKRSTRFEHRQVPREGLSNAPAGSRSRHETCEWVDFVDRIEGPHAVSPHSRGAPQVVVVKEVSWWNGVQDLAVTVARTSRL